MTYLERYQSGEDIWEELIRHGGNVRNEPLRSDALAVAHNIVDRALVNLEELVNRLDSIGYEFGWYHAMERIEHYHGPIQRPIADARVVLDELESIVGHLSVLFRVWQEKIGGLDFRGYHPKWSADLLDPIVVFKYDEVALNWMRSEYRDWQECGDEEDAFQLAIAPDYYHKANVSGGEPYGFAVPCAAIDARVLNEPHHTYFRNYLRICMEWGGFPGVARDVNGIPKAHLDLLTDGLLRL